MNIAILTSNQPRHKYFVEYVKRFCDPKLIILEEKEQSYFFNEEKKFFKIKKKKDNFHIIKVNKKKINSSIVQNALKKYKIEIGLVFGTSLLKKNIFSIPKNGCYNIHTGLVQGFRGVDSCYWAVYKNKPEFIGVTIHKIDSGIDSGLVLIQKRTKLNKRDNLEKIFFKTCKNGIEILSKSIKKIIEKKYKLIPVSLGKNYRSKEMNKKVEIYLKKNLLKILNNYLSSKLKRDKIQEAKGAYKWKL